MSKGRLSTSRLSWFIDAALYQLVILHLLLPVFSQEIKPIPINEILDMKRFPNLSGPLLCADGRWLAYSLLDHRKRELQSRATHETGAPSSVIGSSVFIANLKTGYSINLTEGWTGSSWAPVWSPNGERVAFFSDRTGHVSLWVWEKTTKQSRPVSSMEIHVDASLGAPQWTPDSQKLLARVLALSATRNEKGKRETPSPVIIQYGREPSISTERLNNRSSSDIQDEIAVLDVRSGKADLIPAFRLMAYGLSPDGNTIALMSEVNPSNEDSLNRVANLLTISIVDRVPHVLVRSIPTFGGANFSWSPDGSYIAYTTSYFNKEGRLSGGYFVVRVGGGEPRDLNSSTHGDFLSDPWTPPVWDEQGLNLYALSSTSEPGVYQSLWKLSVASGRATELADLPGRYFTAILASARGHRIWSTDHGQSMIVSSRDQTTFKEGFYSVNLITGAATGLFDDNRSYSVTTSEIDVSDDGRCAVFKAQDVAHPIDIWSLCTDNMHLPTRVTSVNVGFDHYVMGRSILLDWSSLDGQTLHGALLLPAGYETGKRYPLIVCPYPGQYRSAFLNVFGLGDMYTDNMQMFATRGAAVLYPDVPTKIGTEMQDILKTVLPGVDKVIDLGIADPNRLGVMGHSWGGYAVLSLLVQTDRFKAAVSRSGVGGDLIRFYTVLFADGSTPGVSETETLKTGGSLWDKRSVFIENSPVFFLDRIRTPLLLTHGTADQVNAGFSDEVFVCLKRLDKSVQYIKYPSEDHYEADWNYTDQVDFLERLVAWFRQHLELGNR